MPLLNVAASFDVAVVFSFITGRAPLCYRTSERWPSNGYEMKAKIDHTEILEVARTLTADTRGGRT